MCVFYYLGPALTLSLSLFLVYSLLLTFIHLLVFSSSHFLVDLFPHSLHFFSFGAKAIDNFLENNQLSYIIRAHEAHAHGVSLSKGARCVVSCYLNRNCDCASFYLHCDCV